MDETAPLAVLGLVALVGGLIAGTLASNKGHSFGGYFLLGFLLPLIGIIVAAVMQPAGAPATRLGQLTPAPAEGWHRDPTGRFDRRFFDGKAWTMHVTRDADRQTFEDPL